MTDASGFTTLTHPKTDTLVELRPTGEVIWSENASPAEIMDLARLLEPNTRCAMLALWYATHPAKDLAR